MRRGRRSEGVNVEDIERLRRFFGRFCELPDDEWSTFAAELGTVGLARGARFTDLGDAELRIGFVLRGLMRAYYVTSSGREHVRSFVPEDEIVGAFGPMILGEPSNLVVEALEDAELLTFDSLRFRARFARHLAWSELGRRLAERYYVLRERHAAELLTLSGRERYEAFAARNAPLVRRIPQKHVALYLGLTPVSLNRILAERHRVAARARRRG